MQFSFSGGGTYIHISSNFILSHNIVFFQSINVKVITWAYIIITFKNLFTTLFILLKTDTGTKLARNPCFFNTKKKKQIEFQTTISILLNGNEKLVRKKSNVKESIDSEKNKTSDIHWYLSWSYSYELCLLSLACFQI